MTWSVRSSAVRSWTIWTVKVCPSTTTVSVRIRTGVLAIVAVRMSRPEVAAAVTPAVVGQPWRLRTARAGPVDHGAVRADDQGVGAGAAAAEDEAVARLVGRIGTNALDQAHPGVELVTPELASDPATAA